MFDIRDDSELYAPHERRGDLILSSATSARHNDTVRWIVDCLGISD